jgi:hypothetical protein
MAVAVSMSTEVQLLPTFVYDVVPWTEPSSTGVAKLIEAFSESAN